MQDTSLNWPLNFFFLFIPIRHTFSIPSRASHSRFTVLSLFEVTQYSRNVVVICIHGIVYKWFVALFKLEGTSIV